MQIFGVSAAIRGKNEWKVNMRFLCCAYRYGGRSFTLRPRNAMFDFVLNRIEFFVTFDLIWRNVREVTTALRNVFRIEHWIVFGRLSIFLENDYEKKLLQNRKLTIAMLSQRIVRRNEIHRIRLTNATCRFISCAWFNI